MDHAFVRRRYEIILDHLMTRGGMAIYTRKEMRLMRQMAHFYARYPTIYEKDCQLDPTLRAPASSSSGPSNIVDIARERQKAIDRRLL